MDTGIPSMSIFIFMFIPFGELMPSILCYACTIGRGTEIGFMEFMDALPFVVMVVVVV